MKLLAIALVLTFCAPAFSQNPIGIFSSSADVGKPAIAGSAEYDAAAQSYNLSGSGYNIWFNRDEFHYAYKKLNGNFILTGNFALIGKGTDPHRKLGWMVRKNLDEDAMHMTATVHGDGLTVLQWRKLRGAYMRDPQDEIATLKKSPQIIQLERLADTFIMRIANPGEPLQEIARTVNADFGGEVLVGIFISSHNAKVKESGKAWNVRIEQTVTSSHNGYTDGVLGSKLELLDVFNLERKIIYEDTGRIEAPNWMRDGQNLLFNKGGLIYKLPVGGGTPQVIPTGMANRNNNDHVISFDGKMLGISSQRANMPGNGSSVYVVPITGGEPRLITDSTPSYLHSWNPKGDELVYTAQRISKAPGYNIYKKNINKGEEVQLTKRVTGLADGPEYSPDGKYIYYNSDETGTMQLWRMKPDGSGNEQLTFDQFNNWFAHISPDNKWIAFFIIC